MKMVRLIAVRFTSNFGNPLIFTCVGEEGQEIAKRPYLDGARMAIG
jgi:hypothetical protein